MAGPRSRGAGFTYIATSTAGSPTVTSFSPSSGPIAGGTNVTVTGTNFKNGVIVRLGALSGTVMSVTSTSLVVRTPAQAEGVVSLTVLNSDGNGVQLPAGLHVPCASAGGVLAVAGQGAGQRQHRRHHQRIELQGRRERVGGHPAGHDHLRHRHSHRGPHAGARADGRGPHRHQPGLAAGLEAECVHLRERWAGDHAGVAGVGSDGRRQHDRDSRQRLLERRRSRSAG